MNGNTVLVKRIENDFTYHQPPPAVRHTFVELRELAKALALKIAEAVPSGREQRDSNGRQLDAERRSAAALRGVITRMKRKASL